jgi:hypothetical protein
MPCSWQLAKSDTKAALTSPPSSLPTNNQFLRPTASRRSAFSEPLLLVTDLGPKTFEKLANRLTPDELKAFSDKLGSAKLKTVADKFGPDVLQQYGPDFFEQYKGVTADTNSHLLSNDGIVDGQVKGCHDDALFSQELVGNGNGQIISTTPSGIDPDVVRYEYKLFKRGSDGRIFLEVRCGQGEDDDQESVR